MAKIAENGKKMRFFVNGSFPALDLERARGPEARILAVGPASFSCCGPDGPALILLGIAEVAILSN